MTKHEPPPPDDGGRIIEEPLSEALSRRYLAYALSTIMNRALPDVRDGLKPVHRRLLYAMRVLRLDPQSSAKKCARVVGDVIGKYHPHGDTAVYDALVRLAQDFAQRYPLIEGQGNFGNIDGDNAAAMRYTECKLTAAAQLLLDGIDEDAVDFRPTYDGEEEEPLVLPAAFPNLLANGASGIAVGMATSIPPHNAAELIDACLLLLQRPQATTADLMERVQGPDFPTGGVIVESRASLLETYETGRGGVRVRARWEVEKLERGGWRIIVTEIPYQVQKSRLVEQLASLIELKKAPLLGDVRDESTEDIRLVIEPKSRTVEPEHLMESLFRLCDLENRFPVNMNVLDKTGTPGVMGLKSALLAFLDHRREVNIRRSNWRLAKIESLMALLGSDKKQWDKVASDLRKVRDQLSGGVIGKRRSTFGEAPAIDAEAVIEALVVREPITIILSERGWIRAAKGKVEDPSELKFKEGDKLGFLVPAETTDKLLLFASDGRFFTLPCDKLPSARGQGEPLRLMLDIDDKVKLVAVFAHKPGRKRIVASTGGYGFVLPEDEALANRKAGKQVLNVDGGEALVCLEADGDHLAVVGDNAKILIFPVSELPEMPRGKGVKLQSYREGGLRDVAVFAEAEGAGWTDSGGRRRDWKEWREWLGRRAAAGKLAPKGFPVTKRFRPRGS